MSNNYGLFFKRAAAYLIDIVIVFLVGTVISIIPIFNKYEDKYDKMNQEIIDFNKNNNEFIKLLKDNYIDGKIEQEEYNKLIQFSDYDELLIEKYDDGKISSKEYHVILKEADELYSNQEIDFNYKIRKILTYNSIITLCSMLCYFGFLQFILNGQSIGKKIMNLRIVSQNNNKLSLGWLIIRTLIVNNIFFNAANLICLWIFSKNIYINISNIIDTLISIVEAVIIYLIIVRKDARGLHDLVAKTKVIIDDENKIVEGKYVEKWYLKDIILFWEYKLIIVIYFIEKRLGWKK